MAANRAIEANSGKSVGRRLRLPSCAARLSSAEACRSCYRAAWNKKCITIPELMPVNYDLQGGIATRPPSTGSRHSACILCSSKPDEPSFTCPRRSTGSNQ